MNKKQMVTIGIVVIIIGALVGIFLHKYGGLGIVALGAIWSIYWDVKK